MDGRVDRVERAGVDARSLSSRTGNKVCGSRDWGIESLGTNSEKQCSSFLYLINGRQVCSVFQKFVA